MSRWAAILDLQHVLELVGTQSLEDFLDLVEGEAEVLERKNAVEIVELSDRVVAVARGLVNSARLQQS
jgi:hypothetical protein